ncbi:MAG: lytic transglycosylase domain-containing protein [Neomegalonema sp.]|nr:lytic transglycosylase domain-containing protein [Neomegalonema sp.]
MTSRAAAQFQRWGVAAFLAFIPTGSLAADEAPPQPRCAPAYHDPRRPETICIAQATSKSLRKKRDDDICRAIEHFAQRDGLPPPFFARLIWRESLFDPNAVSHAGAQGVAQFMPATARRRGLKDSFNPAEALGASAAFLADLRRQFGNLGLAAAAYNAGEGAIDGVRARRRGAPGETIAYVLAITGLPIEDWLDGKPKPKRNYALSAASMKGAPFLQACRALAATRRIKPMARSARWKPWGALISVNRSHRGAARIYAAARARSPKLFGAAPPLILRRRIPGRGRRALFAAMIGSNSRAAALRICRRIAARGAPCIVVKN